MALAAATQLSRADEPCPGDAELAGAADAADYIAARCLTDAPLGRVGLEIEAHCFDPADPRRRPGWAEIGEVLTSLPVLPGGSRVTVEPGGAVELSSPPVTGAVAAIEAMAADQVVLRSAFAEAGLGLVPSAPTRCDRRVESTPARATPRWSSSSPPATPARPVRQ